MPRKGEPCSVAGCDKLTIARNLCSTHYWRWWKHGDPAKLLKREQGSAQKFILDVALNYEGTECLTWPFNRNGDGRGYLAIDGRNRLAHRLICEHAHGPAPTPAHEAAHSCGKGSEGCVNPRHLRWATHIENEADKQAHGTVNRGTVNGGAKLTEPDVLQIRRLSAEGATYADIAARFGVHAGTVGKIVRRTKWAWLD